MVTKTVTKQELLPGNNLRTLAQKSLLTLVQEKEKIGLVINNELAIAMVEWGKYEELLDRLEAQEKRIEELESDLEDVLLSVTSEKSILKEEEEGQKVENLSDVFNMLNN